jgi:hypothetical protein
MNKVGRSSGKTNPRKNAIAGVKTLIKLELVTSAPGGFP